MPMFNHRQLIRAGVQPMEYEVAGRIARPWNLWPFAASSTRTPLAGCAVASIRVPSMTRCTLRPCE